VIDVCGDNGCCEVYCDCPEERKCGDDNCCEEGQECIRGECKHYCKNEKARGQTKVYDPKTECCTEHGIEPKYPIRHYERCKKTRVARAGHKPTSNGCGPAEGPKVPNTFGKASFLAACNAHDICYDTCRSDRDKCDETFYRQLKAACRAAYPVQGSKNRKACVAQATNYHDAVIALGSIAYEDAQSKACQCCP
jgi:hypothetical protein